MRPTGGGIAMIIVAAALFGLAWHTHIGWFYVADAAVWATLVINLPLPFLTLRALSAQRSVMSRGNGASSDVFEDDAVTIGIDLRSRSLFPKLYIGITEQCAIASPEEREQMFLLAALGPRGHTRAAYKVQAYRRGVFSFAPLHVSTSVPFGLFRARRRLAAPLEVVVYPQVLPMRTNLGQGRLTGQSLASSAPHVSGELRGSREFQRGDLLRTLHWRNSARRGQLMVKEFDRLPQGDVSFAFNPSIGLGEGKDTTLEYSIKIAASLARDCFLSGRPYRMWPGAGDDGTFSDWHAVLDYLARLRPSEDAALQDSLAHVSRDGAVVVALSAADEQGVSLLARQHRSTSRPIAVLLEGFGAGEDPNAFDLLLQAGWQTVRCGPGDIANALNDLGTTITTLRSTATAGRAAGGIAAPTG
jgi:uncharacterized protein (DUF58 family)